MIATRDYKQTHIMCMRLCEYLCGGIYGPNQFTICILTQMPWNYRICILHVLNADKIQCISLFSNVNP